MRLSGIIFASTLSMMPAVAFADEHSEWDRILKAYVQVSQDGVNRFDYARLKANSDDRSALDAYILSISDQDLFTLEDKDAAFAAWANLYNALTVQLIVENYPVDTIRDIKPHPFAAGPWKMDTVSVAGKTLSLDDIEHNILRKEWSEPRVHYAVNCASYGCPNLQDKAWEGSTLNEDLTQAAKDYVNHPRGLTVLSNGKLQVSKIYKWFDEDFGGSQNGVIAHLKQYADEDLKKALDGASKISKFTYDWSLNEAPAG